MTADPGTLRRREWEGRYGTSHAYTLSGVPIPGVTTLIGKGVPKPALPNWKARQVAGFAVADIETWSRMAPEAAIDYLATEPDRQTNRAAARGTEIHALAARAGAGEAIELTESTAGPFGSYCAFLDDWAPEVVAAEFAICSRRWWYAGTADLLARLPGLGLCLIDIKTGRNVYAEAALQLAAYRFAEWYEHPSGGLSAMPSVSWCGVLWLHDDRYQLLPVEAGETAFAAFLHAAHVAEWAGRDRHEVIGEPLDPPREPAEVMP